MKLDKIDLEILRILQKEGRLPVAELATRIHLTTSPCSERVKRMEKSGIIESYHACLSAEKLSQALVIFIHISLDQTSMSIFDKFANVASDIDEIEECYSLTGDFDTMLKVRVKDISQYQHFMSTKLPLLPGIIRSKSEVVIKQFKKSSGLHIKNS